MFFFKNALVILDLLHFLIKFRINLLTSAEREMQREREGERVGREGVRKKFKRL